MSQLGPNNPWICISDVYTVNCSTQIARWGNAVRLSASVVKALDLKQGDSVELHVAASNSFAIAKAAGREGSLQRLRLFRGRLAADFKFDRDEACPLASMPDNFGDSNVLIYLASPDGTKADCAAEIVAAGGMISAQVLNEVTNVARRKMRWPWADIHDFLATAAA